MTRKALVRNSHKKQAMKHTITPTHATGAGHSIVTSLDSQVEDG